MAALTYKDFPDDLHRALKIRAAEANVTMRQLVIDTLAAAVKRPAKPSNAPANG